MKILITALPGDMHTQGMFNFARIARDAGYTVITLPPGHNIDDIMKQIGRNDPAFVGFSYRLSPAVGLELMKQAVAALGANNLNIRPNGEKRRVAFAGLPDTVDLVVASFPH